MAAPPDQTMDSQSKVLAVVFALFSHLTIFSQASHNPHETVRGGSHCIFYSPLPFSEFPVIDNILFAFI